jgi:hypothetical protein
MEDTVGSIEGEELIVGSGFALEGNDLNHEREQEEPTQGKRDTVL